MKYCANCGNCLDDKADYCVYCGSKQNLNIKKKNYDDKPGFFLKLFCLFVPIIGFAMYFYYSDENPKYAKVCLGLAVASITIKIIIALLIEILPIVIKLIQLKI